MTTQIDWQHEIDASFGAGEDQPVGHYVAAGQHAVRRRRRTGLVAGLAAAAVVAGVAWAVAPGGDPTGSQAPVATDPSATADVPAPEPTEEALLPWRRNDPPAQAGPGGYQVRKGSVVHERRDDLYPGKDTSSVALDLSYRGERWWMTLEWDAGGAAMTSSRPDDGMFATFDEFVREAVRSGGMTTQPSSPDDAWLGGLVQWDGQELTERKGVVVVRTVPDPVGDGASIGVVLTKGGTTTWMLITDNGGGASWIEESGSGWSTFEEWLADQVAMASGGQAVQPVRLDGGTVVADAPGVEVLEQQADPDLRAYGTAATGASSAVALIEWKGQRWFVLVIDESVTTVAADKAGGAATLGEFVAFMADQADEGGMR